MARTPKQVEDRRGQIMDAALRVFARKGFAGATNRDIAREAGITPGLIYYYYESKEALLQALIEEKSPLSLVEALPSEMLALPPETFLRTLLLRALQIVESEEMVSLMRVVVPEALHNPAMTPLVSSFLGRAVKALETNLQTHWKGPRSRALDSGLLAQLILSTIMGFVLRRQVLRDPAALRYSQEQVVEAIVETVLNGSVPG